MLATKILVGLKSQNKTDQKHCLSYSEEKGGVFM